MSFQTSEPLEYMDPEEMDAMFFGPPLEINDHDEDLDEALARIKPKQRYAIVQTIAFGFSQVEVAKKMSLSPQAVHECVKKGMRRLRRAYTEVKTERALTRLVKALPQESRPRVPFPHDVDRAVSVYTHFHQNDELQWLSMHRLSRLVNILKRAPEPNERTQQALEGLQAEKDRRAG